MQCILGKVKILFSFLLTLYKGGWVVCWLAFEVVRA